MLLKNLLFSVILGAVIVTALPNPESQEWGLDARDNEDTVVVRDYGHCGPDAKEHYGKCVCYKKALTYNEHKKKCECPYDGQYYDRKDDNCKCPKGKYLNEYKKCVCPKGQVWDEGDKCKYDCGKDAYWNRRHDKCVCKKKGQAWDEKDKECQYGCDTDAD
jgi:hypothetical protein